jgi:hypothetical protein
MQKAQVQARSSSIIHQANPKPAIERIECHAKSVPESAGISAREAPCARLVSFKHASRAKMRQRAGHASRARHIGWKSVPRRSGG